MHIEGNRPYFIIVPLTFNYIQRILFTFLLLNKRNKCLHYFALGILLISSAPYINAQEADTITLSYNLELEATFSGGEHTPFWLVSNKHGLGSPKTNNGWLQGRIQKELNPEKRFSWGAGVDLAAGWNQISPFFVKQLYGEIKYRSLYMMVGSKEIWSIYNDPSLSSGNILYSGNALPIPQIRVGTYDFAPFWGTNNWFWVKGYLAFGKYTDSGWQKSWASPGSKRSSNVLYNSKGIWFRGGNKDKFPLIFDLGIEMATQFGGTVYLDNETIKMPTKFIDWIKAIFPLSGGNNTPMGEQTNVQGNMLGAYNVAISWYSPKNWEISAYYQHYFEDHSQLTYDFIWKDALWGIKVKLPENPFISTFLYEYIYTKDQSGPVNNDWTPEVPEQVSGGDNYFNHYLYIGWQNWGMGIGNPLIISPIYNINHHLNFYDTRIIANHFGLEGKPICDLNWRMLYSFTQNWGTYQYPFKNVLKNFSGLIEINYKPEKLKGWYGKLGLAWDYGTLLGNSLGGMITIGKEGFFNIPLKK